jgi:hypothetical protein
MTKTKEMQRSPICHALVNTAQPRSVYGEIADMHRRETTWPIISIISDNIHVDTSKFSFHRVRRRGRAAEEKGVRCKELVEKGGKIQLSTSVEKSKGCYDINSVRSRIASINIVRESKMNKVGCISSSSSKRRCKEGSFVSIILKAPLEITEVRKSDKFAIDDEWVEISPDFSPAALKIYPRNVRGKVGRRSACFRSLWSPFQALK